MGPGGMGHRTLAQPGAGSSKHSSGPSAEHWSVRVSAHLSHFGCYRHGAPACYRDSGVAKYCQHAARRDVHFKHTRFDLHCSAVRSMSPAEPAHLQHRLQRLRGQGPCLAVLDLRQLLGSCREHLTSALCHPSTFCDTLLATLQLWDGIGNQQHAALEPSQLILIRTLQPVFTHLAQIVAELPVGSHAPSPSRAEQQRRCAAAFASLQLAGRALRDTNGPQDYHLAVACVEVAILLGCTSLLSTFSHTSPVHNTIAEPLIGTFTSCTQRLASHQATGTPQSACTGLLSSLLWTAAPSYPSLPFDHAQHTASVLQAFLYRLWQSTQTRPTAAAAPAADTARTPAPVSVFQQHASTVTSCLSACLSQNTRIAPSLPRHVVTILAHCTAARAQPPYSADPSTRAHVQAALVPFLWQILQTSVRAADAQEPAGPAHALLSNLPCPAATHSNSSNSARLSTPVYLPMQCSVTQGGEVQAGEGDVHVLGAHVTRLQACALVLVCTLGSFYHADSRHAAPQLALLLTSLLHVLSDVPAGPVLLLAACGALLAPSESNNAALHAHASVPRAGAVASIFVDPVRTAYPRSGADSGAVAGECGGIGGAAAEQAAFLVTFATACFPQVAALPLGEARTAHSSALAHTARLPLLTLLQQPSDAPRRAARDCLTALLPLLASQPATASRDLAPFCLDALSTQLAAYPGTTPPGEVADLVRALCDLLPARPDVLLCCCDDLHARARQLLGSDAVCSGGDDFEAGVELVDALLVALLLGPVSMVDPVLALVSDAWDVVPAAQAALLSGRIFDRLLGCQDHRKKKTCVQWYHLHLHRLSLV